MARANLPIRFADDPEFLCADCGEVEVSDEHERCAECTILAEEARRDDHADHMMDLREGR
jgi:hypothetical protein